MQGFHLKRLPFVIRYGLPITAMGLVIFLSNLLVHYPVAVVLGSVDLADWLTWGAFTYPVAFLITDSTNRLFGPCHARQLVYVGFALGVLLTLTDALVTAAARANVISATVLEALFNDPDARSMLRVAIGSGTAFLIAQLIDVHIFDRLRRENWWKAPVASSFAGSLVDTALFFSIAFAGTGLPWIGWGLGDFCAKLLMMGLLLYPFRLLTGFADRPVRAT